jgi:hypothetical protein
VRRRGGEAATTSKLQPDGGATHYWPRRKATEAKSGGNKRCKQAAQSSISTSRHEAQEHLPQYYTHESVIFSPEGLFNIYLTMRQRITFIHKPQDALPPTSIAVASASLAVPSLKAAREDRITFGLDELPEEVRLVLEQAHELHIRYVASRLYITVSPFNSRLSPGLHVYYSPRRNVESSS